VHGIKYESLLNESSNSYLKLGHAFATVVAPTAHGNLVYEIVNILI